MTRREQRLILRLQVWTVCDVNASREFVPEVIVMALVKFHGKPDTVAVQPNGDRQGRIEPFASPMDSRRGSVRGHEQQWPNRLAGIKRKTDRGEQSPCCGRWAI